MEELYPSYSQTFLRLSNKDNYLGKLKTKMNSEQDPYKQKFFKDLYQDVIDSSSVVHFYFKEGGIIKYSQDEVFDESNLICMSFLHMYLHQMNIHYR